MNIGASGLLILIALLLAIASFVVDGFPLVTVAVILIAVALLVENVRDLG